MNSTVVKVEPGLSEDFLESLRLGKNRVFLLAAWEESYVYAGARHGAFTEYLLDGLRGFARRSGSVILISDLFTYIQERFEDDCKKKGLKYENSKQRPIFKADFEENYPISRHLGGKPSLGHHSQGRPGGPQPVDR